VESPALTNSQRLVSLDVFRGLTIAAMVLVNNPGSWSHIYDPLEHASWHGLTPTDWIFPFFLFIVGVAIPISLNRWRSVEHKVEAYRKIVTRGVVIFALGLAISSLPFFQFAATDAPDWLKMLVWLCMAAGLFLLLMRKYKLALIAVGASAAGVAAMNLAGYNVVPYNFGTMRVFGVLQRIAVCYVVVALLFLHVSWRQLLWIAIGMLLGYWLLMTLVPVPGCEITTINDKACNLAAYLDRLILGENHIWRAGKVYDPEGILSTLPAIVTTISGVLTGQWLIRNHEFRMMNDEVATRDTSSSVIEHSSLNKVGGMFFIGTALLAVGWVWNSYFPFNKALWTSSYVVATSGLALLTLASCYWLIDIKGYVRWTRPFVILGVNALALFVFSGLFTRMLGAYRVSADGQPMPLQKWMYENVYLSIAQPIDASLLYAATYLAVWLFLMWLLFRKGIYIKV
jgi:predicted acyltransferase